MRKPVVAAAVVVIALLLAIVVELYRIDRSLWHISAPYAAIATTPREPIAATTAETSEQRAERKSRETDANARSWAEYVGASRRPNSEDKSATAPRPQ